MIYTYFIYFIGKKGNETFHKSIFLDLNSKIDNQEILEILQENIKNSIEIELDGIVISNFKLISKKSDGDNI